MGSRDRCNAGVGWRSLLAVCAIGLALAAAAVGVAVLAGGGPTALAAADRAWLVPAITSRLFVVNAVVVGVCGMGLAAIGWVLHSVGAPARRTRARGREGTVMIEFALALPIALGLTLLMIQSSLLMVGNLCVHYAAFCAARTAIVQVPADDSPDEQPNQVSGWGSSRKLQRIRRAAVWAVMPVSSSHPDAPAGDDSVLGGSLERFFGRYGLDVPRWVEINLGRRLQYAMDHTRVDLLPPLNEVTETYREHEDLRVTVEHTFYLSVPYAARLLATMDADDGVELDFGSGQFGTVIRATCTLPNEGVHDYIDVEPFPQ